MKFRKGDRVIYISKESYSGYKQYDRGVFLKQPDSDNIIIRFDNGYTNQGNSPSYFVLEAFYDSPLYKALQEQ